MGCSVDEPKKVTGYGRCMISGVYVFTDLYVDTPYTLAEFTAKVVRAEIAESKTDGGGKAETIERDLAVADLFSAIEYDMIPYGNGLFRGNETNLRKGGFTISSEPAAQDVPDTLVIKEVVKGVTEGTYRVKLRKAEIASQGKNNNLTYYIYSIDPANPNNKTLILIATNRFKLILTTLVYGTAVKLAISARNRRGFSVLSTVFPFMPY